MYKTRVFCVNTFVMGTSVKENLNFTQMLFVVKFSSPILMNHRSATPLKSQNKLKNYFRQIIRVILLDIRTSHLIGLITLLTNHSCRPVHYFVEEVALEVDGARVYV